MFDSKLLISLMLVLTFTGSLFSEQAGVSLTINQKDFMDGDYMVVSVNMNPAGSSYDEYFYLELPNDIRAFIDPEGHVNIDKPVVRRTVDNPVSSNLVELSLGNAAEGIYAWWIVYIPKGSLFDDNEISEWIYDSETFGFMSGKKTRREYVAVANTDFQSLGTLSILDPVSMTTISTDVEMLSSDPYLCVYNDKIFAINRYQADNIQVIDPSIDYVTTLQFSTGNGSNPQWITFANPNKAYVSRYDTNFNDLLIVNPTNGEEIGTIDMSPYSDNEDKTPRPNQMLMINHELFVVIQDLNASWSGFGISKIVVVNTITDQVTHVIPLEGEDPYSIKFLPETGLIYLSDRGLSWPFILSGGIEVVDPIKKETLGILIDDDLLNGNCGEMEILSPNKGYVIVSDENFGKSVVAFNPESGEILGSVYDSPGSVVESIELTDDGYLLLTERYESISGIMFIDTRDDQLIAGPVSTGTLPPFALDTFHM